MSDCMLQVQRNFQISTLDSMRLRAHVSAQLCAGNFRLNHNTLA